MTTPYIQAADPDDPQPNPPDDPAGIRLIGKKYTPEEELDAVIKSIEGWLPEHQDSTVAVLTCTNDYAAQWPQPDFVNPVQVPPGFAAGVGTRPLAPTPSP